jgi:tRNA nucleotidyltransferase/poly(A) polymerase
MEETARRVAARLREEGYIAYFAGGCVRDMVRDLAPKDYDIATDARPEVVQRLFPRTYAVGAHFGVIVVLDNDFQFEVATFRSDEAYIDGRHPTAVHFSSPEEDARRRDFTINGMFYDPVAEEVIDFVGGRADIAAKLIRAIGAIRRSVSPRIGCGCCGRCGSRRCSITRSTQKHGMLF